MEHPGKESLTVEFKSDRSPLSMADLYKELVAMANTEGGTLFLGIEDDGTVTGVHAQHTDCVAMRARIQNNTDPPLYPSLAVEHLGERPVLTIQVKSSRQLVMTSDGRYLRRRLKQDGTPEVVPMKPHEVMQRLSSIQAIDPSAQVVEDIPAKLALNSAERERLRGMIRTYRGDSSLLELPDEDLDKALELAKERDGVLCPTLAGLLLIGHEQYIREYVPGNEVLFQVMDGENVLFNPPAMRGGLLSIFEKVDTWFQSRITEKEVQVGLFRVSIPNYEKDAFREGFVNALVHRDYFRSGAVQVQLRQQSMVISSPGGFPEGVTPDNILTVAPTPRNRILAEAVKRIGLAERTGRGVDKIYRAMLRNGHEIPDYSDSNGMSVVLRLNSSEMDAVFVNLLIQEEKKSNKIMPIDALIILASLRSERRMTSADIAKRIQKREIDAKSSEEWLVEQGLIEPVGNGKNRRFILNSKVYAMSKATTGYTRQRGMTIIQEKGLIASHVGRFGRITRAEAAELCKCDANHAYYILNQMADGGLLSRIGRGRYAYYTHGEAP